MELKFWQRRSANSVAVEPQSEVQPEAQKSPDLTKYLVPGIPSSGQVRKPDLSEDESQEYARVCKEIGFECGDLVREKLIRFLHDENIHVFNEEQVVKFLDHKLGNEWQWRGLRQIDVDHMGATGSWHTTNKPRDVYFANEPYRGAVPLPVLMTVQKIMKAVPEVFFYVSAPKDDDGDPFLAVTSRWMGMYIVERWDEPDFRER